MPVPPPPAIENAVVQTANDLVNRTLRQLNVTAAGESATIDESNDALKTLIEMIDSWNADRLAIYTTGSHDFPFTIGKQAYTLGSGGDFNMTRPARIDSMSAILTQNQANPIEVPMAMYTIDQWQNQIPVKEVSSSFPQICYDDGSFPLRILNFWGIPSQQNSVRIYSWQPLILPTSLQATIILPAGYAEAFRTNLAVRLASEFNATLRPEVSAIAVESLARIKTMNAPTLELRSDLVSNPAGWNYKADMFGIPY